ncbi:helix-turn-helix domain-containing protein [Marinifilum flexuosum]|uniref:Helix-turn-helix protein n=1 Tax=Marinifilum flexuosum TaxID=1117708 RepID=A0A419X7B6_9BACT|nr:AraC family transcriptional regulator [Marinifilum flexuosum]RKE03460.1 helix-turn-helix protein [Marinifilum flexuosum]
MNTLLTLLLIQGSILSLLLLTRKFNHTQNRFLGAFVLLVVIFSSVELLEKTYWGFSNGYWIFLFVSSKFLAPILLYCYISTFVKNKKVNISKHLPTPLILGIAFSFWCFFNVTIKSFEVFINSTYGIIVSVINIFLWLLYLPLSYRNLLIAKKEKSITTQYLSLLKILLILISFTLLLEVLDDFNDHLHFITSLDFFDVIDLLFLGMIYFISFKAFSQPQMFQDVKKLLPKPEPVAKYAKSNLSSDQLDDIQKRLEDLIQNEKPYLKGDLNIQELANTLKVSRQYLTQVINEKKKCNFNDYINLFRVEEFKTKAKNPNFKNYTLLALALESGFNSKTSFNTIFKKHTGITPSQYRQSIKEDE